MGGVSSGGGKGQGVCGYRGGAEGAEQQPKGLGGPVTGGAWGGGGFSDMNGMGAWRWCKVGV